MQNEIGYEVVSGCPNNISCTMEASQVHALHVLIGGIDMNRWYDI